MTLQHYTYIIGSTDDFNDIDALLKAYNEGTLGEGNASVFEYDAPAADIGGFKTLFKALEIAELIGQGLAFESGWCIDDTVTYLMVGEVQISPS